MRIAVCVKQVPSPDATIRTNQSATWAGDDATTWTLNEPDAYALEEALRLKDRLGAEVVAVSAGPARVTAVLRECLARGADRAVHAEADLPPGDAAGTAEALAAALRNDPMDLVLTGLQSSDTGSGQVGVALAELLGLPHATIVVSLRVETGSLTVTRELEAGWFENVTLPLPALVTVQSGINQLRYATLKGIMAAKKKDLRVVAAPAVTPSPARVLKVYAPPRSRSTRMLGGPPAEAARELVRLLCDYERAI